MHLLNHDIVTSISSIRLKIEQGLLVFHVAMAVYNGVLHHSTYQHAEASIHANRCVLRAVHLCQAALTVDIDGRRTAIPRGDTHWMTLYQQRAVRY